MFETALRLRRGNLTFPINSNNMGFMKERISNVPGNKSSNIGDDAQQSPISLDAIDTMDAEQLRKLIRTVAGAIWGVKAISGAELLKNALAKDDELYEALMLKGITLALNASEWREFNALATFWAERKRGKPQQSVDVTGKIGIVDIVLEAGRRRQLQPISAIRQEFLET